MQYDTYLPLLYHIKPNQLRTTIELSKLSGIPHEDTIKMLFSLTKEGLLRYKKTFRKPYTKYTFSKRGWRLMKYFIDNYNIDSLQHLY